MTDWQNLFSQAPLSKEFASTCPAQQTCIIPRTNHTLLTVSGPDSNKFLQGQCTCDVNRLDDGSILLGAHCNHKGRMNSSFTAALLGNDGIGLLVHSSIHDHAFTSLKKYIVFSKAEIAIADNFGSIYLAGPEAEQTLRQVGLAAPPPGEFLQSGQATILQPAPDQFEIWADEETLLKLCRLQAKPVSENYVDLLNIRRGLGEVRAETVEEFIPQDLNFQLTDGVSFSKGCYTGQEIIARMHYKGKIKKHMYRGAVDVGVLPPPGTAVIDSEDKSIGKIVYSAHDENHRAELLALVNDDALESEAFISGTNSRAKISWLPLPYAIPK